MQTIHYSIIESCMRPSGAYARTLGVYPTLVRAREAFQQAYFTGPEYGIMWSKRVTLVRISVAPRTWTVLQTKDY